MSNRTKQWWDEFFMGMARYIASASKDPSTQVGAVIVRENRTVASMGYNGFPRGVRDDAERYAEREVKYALVVHAEANAIASAPESVEGMTIYCTLHPCKDCAKLIIQSGITEVVVPTLDWTERWGESMQMAQMMFREAGVILRAVDRP